MSNPNPDTRLDERPSLIEIVDSMDINHHRQATDKLVDFINQRMESITTDHLAAIIVGETGAGKSWVVSRAARQTNVSVFIVDALTTSDHALHALFRSNSDENCLVLVDTAEALSDTALDIFRTMVRRLAILSDYKKRSGFVGRSWVNPFVITVQDKYHKLVFSEIYTKLKHTLLEIQCPPLRKQQIQELCIKGCKQAELRLPVSTIYHVCETSGNLAFILNQLQWLGMPCSARGNSVGEIDHRELNIFECGKKIMERKKGGQNRGVCTLNEYLTMWERSPEKVTQSIFNSYPDFVSLTPPLTERTENMDPKEYRRQNGWRLQGADEIALLAESFSDEDVFACSLFDPKMASQIRCTSFWATMHDQVQRAGGGRIQPPTEPKQRFGDQSLRRCNIDRREFERLQGVKLLHQIAMEKKTRKDAQLCIPRDFLLSEQIGFYHNGFAQEDWERSGNEDQCPSKLDMFFDLDSKEPKRKKSKRQPTSELGPRYDAVQILSHSFESTPTKKQ